MLASPAVAENVVQQPAPFAPALPEAPLPDEDLLKGFSLAQEEVMQDSEVKPANLEITEQVDQIIQPALWWQPWNGSVELGMTGTQGNTDNFNVRFGLTAKHHTKHSKFDYKLIHLDKQSNSVQTANSTVVSGRLERPFPGSPFSYFARAGAEYDAFRAYDARITSDSGFSYQLVENDISNLVGRLGGSFSREIGGPDDEFKPELSFGLELKHTFGNQHKFCLTADYFPDLTAFNEFRMNSSADWVIPVAPEWGLSLKLSAIDRYDSTPNGRKSNDLDYSCLILWGF